MLKKITIFLTLVVIALGAYFISGEYFTKKENNTGNIGEITLTGNSSGNIGNSGYIAKYDNALYGDINSNGLGLYKSDLKLKNQMRITDDEALYVNVNDTYIFYVNYSDNQRIYRVDRDGRNRVRLSMARADFLNLEDGWLYYINLSNGSICKLSTDGKISSVIYKGSECTNLIVKNSWVYYLEKNNIYKVDTNGMNKVKIARMRTTSYKADYEWRGNFDLYGTFLYYPGEDGNLYCISTLGGNAIKLQDGNIESINIYNGYIYYFSTTLKTISRFKLEGEVKPEYIIGGGDYYNINIASNDGVMFKDRADKDNGVYMVSMNLSGKGK